MVFQIGNPGGPGRPPGSRNKAKVFFDHLPDDTLPLVAEKMYSDLKGGGRNAQWAAAEIAKRAPRKTGETIHFALPRMSSAATVLEAQHRIADAICSGELDTEQGRHLMGLTESHLGTLQVVQIEERLERLEAFALEVEQTKKKLAGRSKQ
jgi:hypothetical protein